ncbi:hypothetical protein [Belliella aquatica]|uniref:TerB family tellurite resistance protein n=1 Tax=Belliella aquatica TaxID=1323734 RepID=A0ABQ1M1S0_9BACT|nr:hypothetical protein [Belliella aquatica]MCH7406846.1 hypothetical protein [Belliella aquatica]GGC32245.1 hypothetical protein GCM10010993_09060 [Belliella aquatica]
MKAKALLIMGVLLFFCQMSVAQTFNEWFRQKRTQKEYLITQIAALEVYGNLLQKGYQTFQAGSGMVREIKSGEFSLHSNHLHTMLGLSPQLEPLANAVQLTQEYLGLAVAIRSSRQRMQKMNLDTEERLFLGEVYAGMLAKTLEATIKMDAFIRPGNYQMEPEQRLTLIKSMQEELEAINNDLFALNRMLDFHQAYGSKIKRENQVLQNILLR